MNPCSIPPFHRFILTFPTTCLLVLSLPKKQVLLFSVTLKSFSVFLPLPSTFELVHPMHEMLNQTFPNEPGALMLHLNPLQPGQLLPETCVYFSIAHHIGHIL